MERRVWMVVQTVLLGNRDYYAPELCINELCQFPIENVEHTHSNLNSHHNRSLTHTLGPKMFSLQLQRKLFAMSCGLVKWAGRILASTFLSCSHSILSFYKTQLVHTITCANNTVAFSHSHHNALHSRSVCYQKVRQH